MPGAWAVGAGADRATLRCDVVRARIFLRTTGLAVRLALGAATLVLGGCGVTALGVVGVTTAMAGPDGGSTAAG